MITDDDNKDGITISGATETLPEYIKGTPPTIERLRKRFDEAREDPNGMRGKSSECRDYYDGPKQLNSEVRATLKARQQPAIYTNRIRPAINGILGVLESARSDPQAFPRTPKDEQNADICTKTLRYINDECDFVEVKQEVAENFLIEGTGAVITEMDGDKITATQIRFEEFYWDPYSRRNDFLDARYMGVAKWKDADEIKQKYQTRIEEIGDPLAPQGVGVLGDNFQDRPLTLGWVDLRRRRIMLIEEYAVEDGEWKRIVYIASGVLEYGPSPYKDEMGRPSNPIDAVSCYVNRENGRYGPVADMIPIQDEVNASRSRSLHLMNSRQVQQTDPMSPPVDADIARVEAAKADGVLPAGWAIVSTGEQTNANLLRMQEAKGEIERMGPTPAVLGRQGGASESGRARMVLQQAGMTELARPFARLQAWEERVYKKMWDRARQFWTDPMFIRVTDETQAPEFLKVNEPQMGMVMQPVAGPDGQPVIDPYTGQPAMQPTMGVVGYENRLAEMDLDIILDTVQDTATLAQEVWAELVQLVSNSGGLPVVFTPPFQLMIEASPLPDKTRILDLIKAKSEEMEQSQVKQMEGVIQQLQQQLQAKGQADAAEVENKQADTLQKTANAHKAAVDADRAEAEIFASGGVNPLVALMNNG